MRALTKAGAAILAIAALLSACGEKAASTGSKNGGTNRDAAELVLRVETAGGFTPPEYQLRVVPEFSVLGDGRVFTLGPQIEIYPPPAMPPIVGWKVTSNALAKIIAEAEAAGLNGEDRSYDNQMISDAPTTTFTYVDDDGKTHKISVYALGIGEERGAPAPQGQSAEDAEARRKLNELRTKLLDLKSWLKDDVSDDSSYAFT
jgi:hypothetical protein